MSLKTIKIFIASSAELKADRDEFKLYISNENDRLYKQDIYLEIERWENFLDAISDTRLQDEYNKAICECDIALCLFFTKVGKYTDEEFDTAYKAFKSTGKPKIWTYFKDAPVNTGSITEEIMTLFAFKKKIGELGHFYTGYINIDNLKNQFRSQLDKILPQLIADGDSVVQNSINNNTAQVTVPVKNTFNELLTRRLISAIQEYNPRAKKFLENATRIAPDWESQPRCSDPAKEIIASAFVGVLGIQLRKLMAIGKEDMSQNKQKKYLESCLVTSKRALQLLCFALLSKLWDYKEDNNFSLSGEQLTTCTNFFEDEFEWDLSGFATLLKSLISIFTANNLEFPIPELTDFKSQLETGSDFLKACANLELISGLLDRSSYTMDDCTNAEMQLTTVLESLKFLVNYNMMSIKNIDYFEIRNTKPHYLCNYTALGIDSKLNVNQELIDYAETPTTTDAVLIYKENYRQNLNLSPFVIDVNALAYEGGAKICFYSSNDNRDGSLNYNFLEDNSIVNILFTDTINQGSNVNKLLLDPQKRKDMRFDTVFTLFRKAKLAITGIE